MNKEKSIPLVAPERKKYRADLAKDYIAVTGDGIKVWIREGKSNIFLSFLSEDENLSECKTTRDYYGSGFLDEENGLYIFYTDRDTLLGKIGNPVFICKVIKFRGHTPCYLTSPRGKWKEYKIPQNRLFFVTDRWEPTGFYVIAKTPAKARSVVHGELDCEYMDSRATIVKVKDEAKLSKYPEGTVIYSDDTRILEDLEVNYTSWVEEDSVY